MSLAFIAVWWLRWLSFHLTGLRQSGCTALLAGLPSDAKGSAARVEYRKTGSAAERRVGQGPKLKTNYVLVDYENVQVKSLDLLREEHFRVTVFLGPKNTRLPVELVLAMQQLGERAQYVTLETPGSNALDFHIAYYLGALAKEDPSGFFHIISKDTGFDPLIKHLMARKIFSSRSESIEEMPCFTQAESKPKLPVEAEPMAAGPQQPQASGKVDELIRVAVDDLIGRKASKPRTAKTLLNTIHAKCGKERPLKEIEAVYQGLLKRGYVRVDGAKVSYALPSA